jgi:2-C-methyl-D-erythritol 2,4-cyclodiphosphate synthase
MWTAPLVADQPKISPIKERLIENLAKLLGVERDQVSLKGKRREGFCQEEGHSLFLCGFVAEVLSMTFIRR